MGNRKSKTKRLTAQKAVPKLRVVSARLADPNDQPRFHEAVSGVIIEGLPKPAPCPFCRKIRGGIVTVGDKGGDEDGGAPYHHMACDYCGAEGPAAGSQLEAAEKWNAAARPTIDLRPFALKLVGALNARQRAETSVIVSTLALEGQLSDFDNRIAESLKDGAWDGLADAYIALHQAMQLIPESDRPDGFLPDTGVSPNELPDDSLAKLVARLKPIERHAIRDGIAVQLNNCTSDEEFEAVKGLSDALEVSHA